MQQVCGIILKVSGDRCRHSGDLVMVAAFKTQLVKHYRPVKDGLAIA
jgi:hypothetical protein